MRNTVVVTGDKTLDAGDGGTLQCANTAAVITVPKDVFVVGDTVEIVRDTASAVSLLAATNVTIRSIGGELAISAQNGKVCLALMSRNTWLLTGDL